MRLLQLIAGNSFFQRTVLLYFTKVVAADYFSIDMDTVFLRKALATINCMYAMYLIIFLLRIVSQGALAALNLRGNIIISGGPLQ